MNPRDTERAAAVGAQGNRFALASIVRQRSGQLIAGASPRVISLDTKPVSIAILEVARGETGVRTRPYLPVPTPEPVLEPGVMLGRRGDVATIRCSVCATVVEIRRKPDVAPQGRPPSRCAAHGLSESWDQIGISPTDEQQLLRNSGRT